MLTATLQDSPTSYRCFYLASTDGSTYESGVCGGGPGTAFVNRRDSLKQRLAASAVCYYKVRDNRGRKAEAGVCKDASFDKVVEAAVGARPPTFWEKHGALILIGGAGFIIIGGIGLAAHKER